MQRIHPLPMTDGNMDPINIPPALDVNALIYQHQPDPSWVTRNPIAGGMTPMTLANCQVQTDVNLPFITADQSC